jgi:hypothetical protein
MDVEGMVNLFFHPLHTQRTFLIRQAGAIYLENEIKNLDEPELK